MGAAESTRRRAARALREGLGGMGRTAGGRRELGAERARLSKWPVIPIAALICASLASIGIVFAHWTSGTGLAMETTTGNVAAEASGNLAFEFPGCAPGAESRTCDKFDTEVIGTAPLAHSADGAIFEITGWVHKAGEPDQQVGFYYTITGGSVEIGVKAGQNYDEATLLPGTGYWLNPACKGDPGPGGSVTCSPANTKAISHIDFCITVVVPPTCPPPLMQTVTASNVGSIPLTLRMSLVGPAATGADYCGVFLLTVHRLVDGSAAEPPLVTGPLCALIDVSALLAGQIDPGGSEEYKLTISFSEPTAALNLTSGGFAARFKAEQWNETGGWTDSSDLPLNISIGPPPVAAAESATLPTISSATITSATTSAVVNAPLPAVVDVFGRSTVTIASWTVDPNDPSAVLSFEFTVTGDPVYVEVRHGSNLWVDERWEEENPHVWHDPYGVDSVAASPITSIAFGLVPITVESLEEPPTEEPPMAEPPPLGPPAEEPPPEEPPTEPPPAEEPPPKEPPASDKASLNGIVWLDADGDGVRGATEAGAEGVVVRLYAADVEVAATTTATDGSYNFVDLEPGDYTIEVQAASGHEFTPTGQGDDSGLDSDMGVVEPATDPPFGRVTVLLSPDSNDGVADAGLVPPPVDSGEG